MSNKLTDKTEQIALILNKAENASTDAERETFFQAAQAKASRAGLDLEVLSYENRKRENQKASDPISRSFEMGSHGDRASGAYADLFVVIANVNDAKCIWSNKHVDVYGMPFDIDHTEALFNVIVQQMVRSCIEYIEAGEWRGKAKNMHDARRSFYEGYRRRIKQRLTDAKREAEADAKEQYEDRVDTSLVLRDKNQRVNSFYYQDAKNYGYRSMTTGSSRAARSAGDEAGKNARIRKDAELKATKQVTS